MKTVLPPPEVELAEGEEAPPAEEVY